MHSKVTSYRERFIASEERAHYQNIATKILREMSELRSRVEASPTVSKRWIWELIQNAKDVNIGGKIKVLIEVDLVGDKPHVTFRHNGQSFSAENIRFLIEQVSSKDRKKDESGRQKTTGKFGTGFLTTHLLSEIVLVQGVAKEEGLEPRLFEMSLDRSGFDLDAITEAVKKAKDSIQDLDERPPYHQYVPGAFNTAFRYSLTDNTGRNVAKAGLSDLGACIPYTLAFVREIETVEIPARRYSLQKVHSLVPDSQIQMLSIGIENLEKPNESRSRWLAVLHKGFTTIAIPVEQIEGQVHIVRPSREVPRLFCDFPLLGTEKFPFPVIVNNPNFNPTDARDGIFLTRPARPDPQIEENKSIMKEAVSLYLSLLKYASDNSWQNLHFLVAARPVPSELSWIDQWWYTNEILTPIRKALLYMNIVRTATGSLAPILSNDGKKYMWFPSAIKKESREKLWHCSSSWFPHCLPSATDVEVWNDLIWDDCGKLTIGQLAEFVASKGSVNALSKDLSGKNITNGSVSFMRC